MMDNHDDKDTVVNHDEWYMFSPCLMVNHELFMEVAVVYQLYESAIDQNEWLKV